jgi:predicted acylesterase/phospholipase RssA
VLDDGRVLADGGLMNNLPVDVMRSLSPEVVIAVDVSPENEQAFRNASLASPRGFMSKALGQTREANPGLTIVDLLLRATTLQSTRRTRECQKLAEYYLCPEVGAFGIMQWEAIDALMEIGYRHALTRLRDWHSKPAREPYASYRPSFFSLPPELERDVRDGAGDPR